ncbi:hypothetical protein AWH48_11455 [Domibacillus aminovorans]|uniref:Phage protein n=1 Tax=Domibacillus aminovorans TaxID=29332 RepID=A0A177KKK0_9BACI|nr:hypothetical protein [Domibacillus aminovorans]OAH53879.1 hypothetical protein AWH48_11455 [Domibacillus aminovorans]
MNLSLKEQLQRWKEANRAPVKAKPKVEKPRRKKQETYSEREWRSLMGMDMRTLRRGKGGAYKG